MVANETKRLLDSLLDERNGAFLYNAMAAAEKDARLAEVYTRFGAVEQRHADRFASRLAEAGIAVPSFRPSWRTRILARLARWFGPGLIVPTVTGMEQSAASKYGQQPQDAQIAPEEASHARLLQQITQASDGQIGGSQVAQLEGRHRSGGNALRAAVLGANDGLVSNFSLVMGVAGAGMASEAGSTILITGLAGLLAGACSMALGEWLSVQSSRELYQRQIEIEKAEIAASPQDEAEELALIYESRGVPPAQAQAMASQILSDPKHALATLTREELGIDPEELGGSAYVAAGTSFALFAIGAAVPVVAFFFLKGQTAVTVSAASSAVGLFAIGSITSLFTGRSTLWSGMRMVLFGLAAAAITFSIGRLIGVSLA